MTESLPTIIDIVPNINHKNRKKHGGRCFFAFRACQGLPV